MSPFRSKGINPYSEGFMIRYEDSKNKTVIPVSRPLSSKFA
jgi:hypothetical protein